MRPKERWRQSPDLAGDSTQGPAPHGDDQHLAGLVTGLRGALACLPSYPQTTAWPQQERPYIQLFWFGRKHLVPDFFQFTTKFWLPHIEFLVRYLTETCCDNMNTGRDILYPLDYQIIHLKFSEVIV